MKFEKSVKKVFTSKYFLYFLLVLAVTNLLGYLMMKKFNAIALFLIVGVLMHYFSKNMTVILLVCLVVTNLLMSRSIFKEGMESADKEKDKDKSAMDKSTMDKSTMDKSTMDKSTMDKSAMDKSSIDKIADAKKKTAAANKSLPITPQMDESSSDDTVPTGTETFAGRNGKLDYAATVTDAYKGLNDLLDPDAIKNLTQETMTLMKEQQNLYKSMEAMSPLLAQAKDMLSGMDMNNLQGLGDMVKSFAATKP